MTLSIASSDTIEAIVADARDIVARTGLRIEHAEVRTAVLNHPGFTCDGERVRIAPAAIEAWLGSRTAADPAIDSATPFRAWSITA